LQDTARQVAGHLTPPVVLFLEGDLGTGKTTFVRALLRALGHRGPVKSPTYGLMEVYDLPGSGSLEGIDRQGGDFLRVVHLDLYRIADPDEIEFLGLGDLLDERTVLCVEWPEQGAGALPPPDLILSLEESIRSEMATRDLLWYAYSDSGIKLCKVIDAKL
jgi:tRNA threonylcarbamoyladenosine biosynthesis protein TsaE